MDALEAHHWPGNIRELQNVIERGVIMTTGSALSPQTIEPLVRGDAAPIHASAAGPVAPIRTIADAERAHIIRTLRQTDWAVGGRRGAAAQLGLPRTTLIARMQRLGIATGTSGIHSHFNLRVMEAIAG